MSGWDLSVRVSDGADGTGVDRVSLKKGNGTLNTSLDAGNENVTLVSYSASCCDDEVQLEVVDRVGNTGSCFYTSREGSQSAQSSSTSIRQSLFLCLNKMVLGFVFVTQLVLRGNT